MKNKITEQFKAVFPLKGVITQEIINNSNVFRERECIGANTLREALPDELKRLACWGAYDSCVHIVGEGNVFLTTVERVNMMKVTEPMEVTFILKEY